MARIVAVVGFVGLSFALVLGGISTAEATGYARWTGYATQAKRPQFRPWQSRSEGRSPERWRPFGVPSRPRYRSRDAAAARQPALLNRESRYPRAGQSQFGSVNAGGQFRPNGRLVNGVDRTVHQALVQRPVSRTWQSRFRPTPAEQRQTYEQLQARAAQWPNRTPRTFAGTAYPGGFVGRVEAANGPSHWHTRW